MAMSIRMTSGRWASISARAVEAVGRLGDDLDARQALQERADAGPEQG